MPIAAILLAAKPDLDQTKIQQFKNGFIELKNKWDQSGIDAINSEVFKQEICQQFDQLLVNLGYGEFDPDAAESLIHSLYLLSDHKSLIEYIVLSYRQQCDDDILGNIYELMLEEMHHSFDE
ncbi:MAG: hypothetical protein LWW88_07040 [Acinetobacter sp.]|uniref:hypothetical protein n=1 Tax=Acinetobacter sp. TaxID=472 RepID=UPI00258C83A6|nr:hypothetical protein [Acinetobacter sp.]MCE1271305.1 hypothetical protein [Acinetobacter sp.]